MVMSRFVPATLCLLAIAPGLPADEPKTEAIPAAASAAAPVEDRKALIGAFKLERAPDAVLKAWQTEATDAAKSGTFQEQLAAFQQNVIAGRWDQVKTYLAGLPTEEGTALYQRLLLQTAVLPPEDPQVTANRGFPIAPKFRQKSFITAADVIGLLSCAPQQPIPQTQVKAVSGVLKAYLGRNGDLNELLTLLRAQLDASSPVITRAFLADALVTAGHVEIGQEFLPDRATAIATNDPAILLLVARFDEALYEKSKQSDDLNRAWEIVSTLTLRSDIKDDQRNDIQSKCLELLVKLPTEQADIWLKTLFDNHPETTRQILVNVGARALRGLEDLPTDANARFSQLKQLNRFGTALIEFNPKLADELQPLLSLTATAWLRECDFSIVNDESSAKVPDAQRDAWGNIYYDDFGFRQKKEEAPKPVAIRIVELLKIVPSPAWQEKVERGLAVQVPDLVARMAIKIGDFPAAADAIGTLAKQNAELAHKRANDFLDSWTSWHDSNSGGTLRTMSSYAMMFGGQQGGGIPLTRSKQNRNLGELEKWVRLFQTFPMPQPDQEKIVKAFVQCHGAAEVYQSEAISGVFGSIKDLKPVTVADLAQAMRSNLAGMWRSPKVQDAFQTKRTEIDMQEEVKHGYITIGAFVREYISKYPQDWRLALVSAALLHDEAEYLKSLGDETGYIQRRTEAFAGFQKAAESYAAALPTLTSDNESNDAFEFWFAASLGACDLPLIAEGASPFGHQTEKIRNAILALPGDASKRHMERFANQLFTRMSALKPNVKYSYLHAGFDIVGDHPAARDARETFEYYSDLLREIQLVTELDGPSTINPTQPFGLFVNIRHTLEIERESGGFSKYLKAPNRFESPVDYRERFEKSVQTALSEQFDVISITIEDPAVKSRTVSQPGWRVTPYAYVTMKVKGPQVDIIPPLSMTFDFNDKNNTVALPISSKTLAIDAKSSTAPIRPVADVTVNQTVDERKLADGILIVDIMAKGHGLIPPLEDLLTFEDPGFAVSKMDDRGILVQNFDNSGSAVSVNCERQWQITFKPKEATVIPASFTFGKPKLAGMNLTLQRYDDADLVTALATIPLNNGKVIRQSWPLMLAGLGAALVMVALFVVWRQSQSRNLVGQLAGVGDGLPTDLTPFIAVGLLRNVLNAGDLNPQQRGELQSELEDLEEGYFRAETASNTDLRSLCQRWLQSGRMSL
ncbi:hypothetical protein [Planctomicrobium piriforme]|uniref:Uncharacterized protein n=1 Tax=Planctomicrobium piriforme TaxID=1576369 RepID=A0A1I3JWS3_9PLAN|nr:hypothetical protein [Planctomicrobium piriforme]SFI64616.1 hypothetical protein SAMN05421753_11138 [Planctomicrobium piriforme]